MKTLSFAVLIVTASALLLVGCADKSVPPVAPGDNASITPMSLNKGVVSGQLIAFASNRGPIGGFNIYLMKSNGDKVTQLTFAQPADNGPEYYGRPDWSPDGTRMTITTVLQADGFKPEIYTMNADGSDKKNLHTPGLSEASRWSLDGTKIAFGMSYQNTYQIYVMNPDGSNLNRVTNDPYQAHDVTWAPDSRRVAYSSYNDGQIHVINIDGTSDRILTNDPVFAMSPAWSTRGDVLLFVSYRDYPDYSSTEIYSMNVDGTGLKRLTNNSYVDYEPRWSANQSQIVFLSSRNNNFDLYVMNANGSGETRITADPGFDADPAWIVGNVNFK